MADIETVASHNGTDASEAMQTFESNSSSNGRRGATTEDDETLASDNVTNTSKATEKFKRRTMRAATRLHDVVRNITIKDIKGKREPPQRSFRGPTELGLHNAVSNISTKEATGKRERAATVSSNSIRQAFPKTETLKESTLKGGYAGTV